MKRHLLAGAAALALVPFLLTAASAQLAISANDGKVGLDNGKNIVIQNPPADYITIFDLGQNPPKVIAEVDNVPSSVVGPPQSVAISKDVSFALVTGRLQGRSRGFDESRPRQQAHRDRPQGKTHRRECDAGSRSRRHRRFDQSCADIGARLQPQRRHRLGLQDFRKDADARRQDFARRREIRSESRRLHARRQDGDRHPRRRPQGFDSEGGRRRGHRHQEHHDRRLPSLQPRDQLEGRYRCVRQPGRRHRRRRRHQRRRSEVQSAAPSSTPSRSGRRRKASRCRRAGISSR